MKAVNIGLIFLISCNPYIGANGEMSAFTVVSSSFITNYNDRDASVKIAVLPFTPKVVLALSALRKEKEHWTDARYTQETDELLMDVTGLAVDTASSRLAGRNGWRDSPDSVVLYVHLINTAWPCANVTFIMGDAHTTQHMFGLASDVPCPQVEVDSILSRITVNGSKAEKVWGKKNQILRDEETLFCIYHPKSTAEVNVKLP